MVLEKNSFTACSPDPFAPLPNPLFLWHYLICINIFMCVHFQVLLLYHLLSQSLCLIGYPLVFNGTSFLGFHGYSAWLGRAAQPIGECRWAGGCEAVPHGPRRAPPPLPLCEHAIAQWGGSKTKTTPPCPLSTGSGLPLTHQNLHYQGRGTQPPPSCLFSCIPLLQTLPMLHSSSRTHYLKQLIITTNHLPFITGTL